MKRRVRRRREEHGLGRTLGTWGLCTNSAATRMAETVRRSPRDEAARVRRRREEHGLGITLHTWIVYKQRGNLDGGRPSTKKL